MRLAAAGGLARVMAQPLPDWTRNLASLLADGCRDRIQSP